MSRRWSGILNFSMSVRDMERDKVMTRLAACLLSPALIAPAF